MPTRDEIEHIIMEKTEAELSVDMQNHERANQDFELYQNIFNLVPVAPE